LQRLFCPGQHQRFDIAVETQVVKVAATDPLNLVGILTPGPRIPALRTNEVVYRDGLPVGDEQPAEVPASATVL
jgi:hypothetical protein